MNSVATDPPQVAFLRHQRAQIAAIIAICLLETVLARTAVVLAPAGATVAAFWPNSGLSVIALMIANRRWTPLVLSGIFVANVIGNYAAGRPLDSSIGFGFVNAIEALVVVTILYRTQRRPRLETFSDLTALLAAGIVGAITGGLLAGFVVFFIQDGPFWLPARSVFASHGSAILLIVPIFLTLRQGRRGKASPWEAAAQSAALIGSILFSFYAGQGLPFTFSPYPLLVWGALRLSVRQVAWQLAATTVLMCYLTLNGKGPFANQVIITGSGPEMVGTLLQLWLLGAVIIALPLVVIRTNQETAFAELQDANEDIAGILGSTTETLIVGTDSVGLVTLWNVGASRITQHSRGDVVGRGCILLSRDPGGTRYLKVTEAGDSKALLEGHEEITIGTLAPADLAADYHVVAPDGTTRIISLTLIPQSTNAHGAVEMLIVGSDVTERAVEAAALQATLDVEREARESLAALDRTKGEFLATVSHELRTPITSIMGYSQLLLAGAPTPLAESQRHVVERIERNGRRLLGLIEDMLTVSQVEVGGFRVSRALTDASEPVSRAADEIRSALPAYSVTLQLEMTHEPLPLWADEDKIQRLVWNLLSNAAKFSKPQGEICLRLTREDDYAVIAVTDHGVGISPTDQQKLFERFFRSTDANSKAVQGAGLGLSIVSAIVGAHDGRVLVESALGEGTTFTVRLPLVKTS